MDRATIKATVEFPTPTLSGKTFRVYRDSQLVPESVQTQPLGRFS